MAQLSVSVIILATLATTEIAWWEGRRMEQGTSCAARGGDGAPMALSPQKLKLGEAECVRIREKLSGRKLTLTATCFEHGEARAQTRTFTLKPLRGGKAMVMSDGKAVWHLRKCQTGRNSERQLDPL